MTQCLGIADSFDNEDKYQRYVEWIRRENSDIECVRLSHKRDNGADFNRCQALLLTGGGDVDPSLYNGDSRHPKLSGVDRRRDDFEYKLIDQTMKRKLPLLGICRGLQVTNTFFGGSLMEDIEENGFDSHRGSKESICEHDIRVYPDSLLAYITGSESGKVNSYHHQAIDTLGKGLRSVAYSSDGIIEAVELDRGAKEFPFFLLVQWHPERMTDAGNPLSHNIVTQFLKALPLLV